MSPMGTDENAVRADAESAAVARANGDGAAFGAGAVSTEASRFSDGLEADTVGEEELTVVATARPASPQPGVSEEPAEDEATVPDGPAADVDKEPDLGGTDEAGPAVAEPGVSEEPAEDEAIVLDGPAADVDQELDAGTAPDAMSQMIFVDVVLVLPATHPVVVLQEADAPFRELRIPVGGAEGIAISYAGRGLETPRPLTHELFARVLEEFGMTLDVVRITEVRGTAFTAEMVISGRLGTRVVDCRPSDAIALALRHRLPVPIMVDPNVLEVAGTSPMGAN